MLRGLGVGHQAAVAPAVVMLSAVVEPGAEAQLLVVTGEPGPGLFKMFSSCYVQPVIKIFLLFLRPAHLGDMLSNSNSTLECPSSRLTGPVAEGCRSRAMDPGPVDTEAWR